MTYATKQEFMDGLRAAIGQYDIPDARDILLDFEQHFTDGAAAGESEADVCRKLGDVEEIAKQYISDDDFAKAAYSEGSTAAAPRAEAAENAETVSAEASGFDTAQSQQTQAAPQPQYTQAAPSPGTQQGFTANGGAVAGVLLVDIFVFTWAIPTLFSLIMALISIALTFAIVGIVSFFGGTIGLFFDISGLIATGFAPVTLVFLGMMMMGFAGMLTIASIGSVKGFISIIKSIINWHSRTFAGYDVFRKESK